MYFIAYMKKYYEANKREERGTRKKTEQNEQKNGEGEKPLNAYMTVTSYSTQPSQPCLSQNNSSN